MKTLRAAWLGRVGYNEALALQHRLADAVAAGTTPETLLLLEHDPVYTLGRRASEAEILLDEAMLSNRGIEVVRTDRGGKVTYHGPGQLTGYPILNLGAAPDIKAYVCELQRAMVEVCAVYGVPAHADAENVGAWVGDAKIGAIGVHVSRGITTHGFALNVSTDLDDFNGIIPCGIVDKGVTSLEALAVSPVPSVEEVARRIGAMLGTRLRRELSWETVLVDA